MRQSEATLKQKLIDDIKKLIDELKTFPATHEIIDQVSQLEEIAAKESQTLP